MVEAFDSRLLDCSVHSLDLAVRPGVLDLGEPAFDLVLATDPVEDVLEGVNVAFMVGKLNTIIHCPAMVCLQTMRGGSTMWTL